MQVHVANPMPDAEIVALDGPIPYIGDVAVVKHDALNKCQQSTQQLRRANTSVSDDVTRYTLRASSSLNSTLVA